ncbi:MAG: hypothetical protein ACFFB3_20770 [Candidatus Hodarchaeota archaeon]
MTNNNPREGMDNQLMHEMRRIEAAQAVLKRKGLDLLDQMRTEDDVAGYQSVLALWQNEGFLAEVEATVLAELEPDPGGIRCFLADFETQIEDLDARWLLALWWQASGTRVVDFQALIGEYQSVYTEDLLQRLESMQQTPDVDSVTQRRLNVWQQAAERELVDSVLVSQRTGLRQDIASYRFHHQSRDYTASQIPTLILREEQNRELRRKAWNSLAQLSQQMAPKMRKLLLQTNAYWQEKGYVNANAPRLQALGVSESVVRQAVTNCEQASRSAAQELISAYKNLLGHELEPWDWRFAAGQMVRPFERAFEDIDAINITKQTYENLGIMIDQLPIQIMESSTTYQTKRYCVRIPHDIIFSYGPLSGYRKPFVLIRDLGKACSFTHIDEALPYPFRRYAPEVLLEGLGTLASWVLWEPDWLQEYTDLTANQVEKFVRQMKGYELLKTRHYACLALFELDAYAILAEDTDADLMGLYKQYMEQFLLLPQYKPSIWAAEPRLILHFPYLSQYVLSLAVAANLLDYFQRRGMALFSPHFGDLLRSNLVQLGNASSWVERLQQLTARSIAPFPMSWSTMQT